MTKFRIRMFLNSDGEALYQVQTWRLLPFPYWSSTYYWKAGGQAYYTGKSYEQAKSTMLRWMEDTHQKKINRPWKIKRVTVEEAEVE